MPAVVFEHVDYSYIDINGAFQALEDINLRVDSGEFVCLLGRSGCGKSTMLSLIAGLAKPSAGRVLVDGAEVAGPGPDRSIVFQNYSLFPWQKALKNVVFALRQTHPGMTKETACEQALGLLERVGMSEGADRYPFQLSGGMRQRVAIARALAVNAPIMLLDEPFGALDPSIRKKLQDMLLELWDDDASKCCKTAIFVTHDVDEALILADRIVFMEPKHVVKDFILPARQPGQTGEDRLEQPGIKAIKREVLELFEKAPRGKGDEE
ncbi:MAG: ABC transporter ATP-binding protein [Coriobacteriales bacterium]|nr:ABC transporter ATP-binding protein [Coriobacteriales bacterium]MBQ6586141.1 ABC transporter ATP-binding protein [Coriobacteriales bacterium]